jgi:hypothetical protein
MACHQSLEPDGYHRFMLAPRGLEFETVRVHCGLEKLVKPFNEPVPHYCRHAVFTPLSDRRYAKCVRHSRATASLRPVSPSPKSVLAHLAERLSGTLAQP